MNKLFFVVVIFAAACGKPAAMFGDMGLPPDCQSRCPAGYSCDNGTCVGGDPNALNFNLKTFAVNGRITVDGQPPTASAACSGDQVRVQFSEGPLPKGFFDPVLGSLVSAKLACTATDGAIATRLPAGDYRVLATRSDTNSTFPDATMAVQPQLTIKGDSGPLAWDVKTVSLSGRLTVGGQPPIPGAGCSGDHVRLSFLDSNGGSFNTIIPCSEQNGAFSVRLAPANYRVLATRSDSNTTFPDATVVVQRSFDVSGAMSGLSWDIATAPVSGSLTVDGQPPIPGMGCSGDHVRLSFINDDGASFNTRITCDVSTGAFSTRVAQGSYRVLATRSDSNTTFPDATAVAQRSFNVTGPASGLSWDIPTAAVSGTITLDGKPPVPGTGCSGDHVRLSFVNDDGASFNTRITCDVATGAFSTRVAQGSYRVLASRSDTNTTFPNATVLMQPSFQVGGSSSVAWNVTTVPVHGIVTVDGQPPTPSAGCSGDHVRFNFFDPYGASYSYAIPCSDATGAFSLRVASGTYRILASRSDGNTTFPDATFTLVNALTIH